MATGVQFTREDLALLYETLSYAHKRTFSEGEKVRMKGLLGRLEGRLLDTADPTPRALSLTEPEIDAVLNAADTYCDALQQPLSAESSRGKATRVRALAARFQPRQGFLERLRRLFGRG